LKERYKIEQKFGEGKQNHGLGRCRYLGKIGFAIQTFFTAIVLNFKLFNGVEFKSRVVPAA